jgi:predicted PurR-regulated permease PerM
MESDTEPVGERAERPLPLPPWPWIWKLLATLVAAVFLGMLTLNILRGLRSLIEILVVSLFLSFALEPAVAYLAKRGMRRGLATFAILFGVFVVGILLVAAMVPVFVRQLQALVEAAPDIFASVTAWAKRVFGVNLSPDQIQSALQSANSRLTDFASNIAGNVFGIGVTLLATVFKLLAIGLFTFYMVADGPRFRRQICSLLLPKQQQRVLDTWEVAIDKTGGFLYSRLLLAVFSGIATFTALVILDVDFALPLAVWMGLVSQFIPTIGTYIAMSLPLLVAVVKDPWDALILLIFFTVYQQVENYILSPRVAARTMNLHPALAFGSAIAGASLYGVIGAFLALPAAAIIQAVISAYVQRHEVITSELTSQPSLAADEDLPPRERRRLFERLRRKT